MSARIIGVGQEWAGDDAVGLAVIGELRKECGQCDLVALDEPTRLIDLLTDGADPIVLIDAVLDDGPPGRVLLIDAQRDDSFCTHLLSTHGVSVMDAIELARITHPDRTAQRISIVGITIQQASRHGQSLSAEVAASVPRAAQTALSIAVRN